MTTDGEEELFDDSDALDFSAAARPRGPAFGSLAEKIGARNLMIIIVTMPLVFVVVVATIVNLTRAPEEKRSAAPTQGAVISTPIEAAADRLAEPATLASERVVLPISADETADLATAIALPEGATAGAISLDGDRLAVRVDSAAGAAVVIYDLTEQRVIQTVPLANVASAMVFTPTVDTVSESDALDAAQPTGEAPTPTLSPRRDESDGSL